MFQMAIKYSNYFHPKALRNKSIHPNWDFRVENKPSGKPEVEQQKLGRLTFRALMHLFVAKLEPRLVSRSG
jgi:hypothetical protein